MTKFKISIGDWSEDGHNKYEQLVFTSNKSVKEMQDAYKQSCKNTGIQFNHNQNYTDRPENNGYSSPYQIWTEYEDSGLSEEAKEILTVHGLLTGDANIDPDGYDADEAAKLILNFIKLSLPDLEVEEATFKRSELDTIEPLNGWWCKELNHQFGYGLFE